MACRALSIPWSSFAALRRHKMENEIGAPGSALLREFSPPRWGSARRTAGFPHTFGVCLRRSARGLLANTRTSVQADASPRAPQRARGVKHHRVLLVRFFGGDSPEGGYQQGRMPKDRCQADELPSHGAIGLGINPCDPEFP
jgi:hypothetical protein